MKKSLLFLSIVLPLFISNCDNDDDSEPEQTDNYTSIGIVTGLNLMDDNGSPIGCWKSPNDKQGAISAFPNLSNGYLAVFSNEIIDHIWLVPAECQNDSVTMNITLLSQSLDYEISEIAAIQVKDIPISNFSGQINLDLSDVSTGFYKIFYQKETGGIFWQNLYIEPAASSPPTFEDLDGTCE